MASLLAVSLDLDEVHHHLAIHGLPKSGATLEVRAAFRFALPRALAFARDAGVVLTLFAVSSDLDDPFVASALRAAIADGHVVESHSATHPYDLVRWPAEELRKEIVGSMDRIEAVLGRRPVGFRAPGYLVDEAVFDRLDEAGALFDSSVLPSPAYFVAKTVIRAAMELRGRSSASSPGGRDMSLAPRVPHRPGRDVGQRGARRFIELPIAVTPRVRLPLIGTLVGGVPAGVARRLARSVAADRFVGFELHAMDFLDGSDPTVGALRGHQPELRRALESRVASLHAFVSELRARGFSPCTLEDAARVLSATLPPGR
jgi:hypothetical protein